MPRTRNGPEENSLLGSNFPPLQKVDQIRAASLLSEDCEGVRLNIAQL